MKHGRIERSWQSGDCTGGEARPISEMPSPSGEYKAVIWRGFGIALRVSIYRHLYDEAVDECYWSQVSGTSLADGTETAEKIAREELRRVSGEAINI